MALKNTILLLVFTFSLLLSYPIEAQPAPSPLENQVDSLDPIRITEGPEYTDRKQFIAAKVKEAIPKAEEFLQKIKQRLDETPGSSASEQCFRGCMVTYEKIVADMKPVAEDLSLETAKEFNSKISGLKEESEKCELCTVEEAKEDPDIMKYNELFNGVFLEMLNEINKYDS